MLRITSTVSRKYGIVNFLRNKTSIKTRMAALQQIVENNECASALVESLQSMMAAIQSQLVLRQKQELIAENAALEKEIEEALAQLVQLEVKNGKKQILVPGARTFSTDAAPDAGSKTAASNASSKVPASEAKAPSAPPKEKKVKEKKPAAEKPSPVAEAPVDVGRLDLRVGKIVEVGRHPDADSLYLEKIDCGEAAPRTVVSGLVKFVPLEEMQNRMVVVMCNLKPAKMRGVTSEAMVMCASTPDKVEVLSPPVGAVPGDLVHCEGYTRQPDAQLNPKKKVFETCAPDLMTNADLVACYKGSALHVPGKGNVVSQSLKNVNVK
ncbi:aminoacyl tRNA synthase complex-interacting multifunctional protein 1 [Drosophila madeirensis]|uniref:Aminoacyl tRNA synthase complex-interacting multifunctional protein 1 n=1 Tax=Drosophila madeirensis TaxID=30013 RepID=A0AAU9GAZ8_DROMD